jgi:hypothetical protein
MRRLLLALTATVALAACQSPTAPAPARTISAGAPRADIVCRSGFSVVNGRCEPI